MAYPVGSPRRHLRDKPWQERKIEGKTSQIATKTVVTIAEKT